MVLIFNIIIIIYLIYSIKKTLTELKEKYEQKDFNLIVHGALLGIIGSTTVSIFSKTLVAIIDLISGG